MRAGWVCSSTPPTCLAFLSLRPSTLFVDGGPQVPWPLACLDPKGCLQSQLHTVRDEVLPPPPPLGPGSPVASPSTPHPPFSHPRPCPLPHPQPTPLQESLGLPGPWRNRQEEAACVVWAAEEGRGLSRDLGQLLEGRACLPRPGFPPPPSLLLLCLPLGLSRVTPPSLFPPQVASGKSLLYP